MPKSRLDLRIFPSPVTLESRLMRQLELLLAQDIFDKIVVYGLPSPELPDTSLFFDGRAEIRRPKLVSKSLPKSLFFQGLKYFEWSFHILRSSMFLPATVVECHRLSSLPIGLIIKFVKRIKLIYQTHELETETHELAGIRKKLFKLLEMTLIRRADAVVVVSDSIADWYENRYNIPRPLVIRSIPKVKESTSTKSKDCSRKQLGLEPDDILFSYIGVLSRSRKIEDLQKLFSKVPSSRHIIFFGDGELAGSIISSTRQFTSIHYHPAVPHDEVVDQISGADVGLVLFDTRPLSRSMALPNKFFEHLLAGVPVIVPNTKDLSEFVKTYDCGWVVDSEDMSELYELIVTLDHLEISVKKANAMKVRESLDWKVEHKKLVELYTTLIT